MNEQRTTSLHSMAAAAPNFDKPVFSLSDLAKASESPLGTVKMWIERQILQMDAFDMAARGKGTQRLFTLRTVMVAATIAEAVRIGVSPSKAAMWAHIIWRTPFLEEGPVPRAKSVFIGNPNWDHWRICGRDGLSAEVIFGGADPESAVPAAPAASAVLIDVAAIDRRCRAALRIQDVTTERQ